GRPVRAAVAAAHAPGRIPRGAELGGPTKGGARASYGRARAGGPEREPGEGTQPRGADGGVIDRLGEARVAVLAPPVSAGRDEQRVGRIAQRQLAHPTGDAAA